MVYLGRSDLSRSRAPEAPLAVITKKRVTRRYLGSCCRGIVVIVFKPYCKFPASGHGKLMPSDDTGSVTNLAYPMTL